MNEGMTRRQKLTVSIVGVTLILLTLLGITYAYYLTRIEGNTNENSISITTAKLELLYADGNGELTFTSIMPGTDLTSKTFSVTNNGNSSVNEYAISLEEVTNTLTRTEDLTYTLTCKQKNSTGSIIGECNGVSGEYPKINKMLVTNSIEVGYTHEYELKVTYENLPEINQSIDMGSTIKGKVQIYGLIDTVDLRGTVSNYTEGDYVQINSETKTSRIVNNEYMLVGIKPGMHTIKVCSKEDTNCTDPSYEKKIVINKGATAGVGETTIDGETYPLITITNESQVARINIDTTSTTLNVNTTVSSYNPFKEGTLAYNIYQNKALVEEYDTNGNSLGTKTNKDIKSLPVVTGVSDGTNIEDSGLFMAQDDYGTSYFYRGTVRNNYVDFAGFTWRIVRINGDNSVRLILETSIGNTVYNEIQDDAAYVGYTYGTFDTNSTSYDEAFKYIESKTDESKKGQSLIKQKVDEWYETNILNKYDSYISDTLFCNDKSFDMRKENQLGYGTNKTYYDASRRLWTTTAIPNLKCIYNNNTITEEQAVYSRYTVNGNDINGIKTNNYLIYPIGLPTGDELVFAGTLYGSKNTKYHLNNPSIERFWTMTPVATYDSYAFVNYGYWNYSLHSIDLINDFVSIRPVINISPSVLVDSGIGTKSNPYKLKLAS